MRYTKFLVIGGMLFLVLAAFSLPAGAQSDLQVIASGLNAPRGLAYGPDGALYIAEGGSGGDIAIDTPEGPSTFGSTGRVVVVAPDGSVNAILTNLPSVGNGGGPNSLIVGDESIWLITAGGPPNTFLTNGLIEIDRASLRMRQFIDLLRHEQAENPDGNEIDSNPVDLAVASDGTLYIVDAACNCVLTWTAAGGLQTFHAWPDNPVPTSVAFGPEGDLYIGFLSPAPFIPGSAKIEQWTTGGELVNTFGGLTMVVDVLVDNAGTIYASQVAGGMGPNGPEPGSVVRVGPDGATPLLENITAPYGLAQDADGNLIVAINAAFAPPGSGQVVVVPTG